LAGWAVSQLNRNGGWLAKLGFGAAAPGSAPAIVRVLGRL